MAENLQSESSVFVTKFVNGGISVGEISSYLAKDRGAVQRAGRN